MRDKVSILHISDLHRSYDSPVSNAALLTSLLNDREKYTNAESPPIQPPDFIIVCGDIIRGSENASNSDEEIQHQYDEAITFLTDLANKFLDGNKNRVVLIPGNHDVDWKYSRQSMTKLDSAQVLDSNDQLKNEYLREAINDYSRIRWSWRQLSFYKVTDYGLYIKRLEAFANFYGRFYDGERSYSIEPETQYDIFDYPEFETSIVGYNSCYNNDHLNLVGDIHPDCIATSAIRLKELSRKGRLLLATWHHNTKGLPYDADYMDSSKLKNFIDADITLGFHGHQHRAEIVRDYNNLIEQKRIVIFSTGTLCGAPGELPTGQNRQYNLVEIEPSSHDETLLNVTLHTREKTFTSPFDNPIWSQGHIDSTNVSFYVTPLPNPVRATFTSSLLDVEALMKEGKYEDAKGRLLQLDLTDPFVRKFLLDSLIRLDDYDTILRVFCPPRTNEEAVSLLGMLWQSGNKDMMAQCVQDPFIASSNDAIIIELRDKIGDYLS